MSDTEATPIDLTAEVSVPEGEVSREDLVKILEDSRKTESTEEAPAVVETPKVEPPAEKVSARIIASRKAEIRQAEERRALAAEREANAAEKAAIADAKAQLAMLDQARMSPSKLLELAKKSPREFIEALANENEPEEVAKRAMAGTQTEVQRLATELASLRAERAAEVQAKRHAEIQQGTQAAGADFVEFVAANVDKYPALVEAWTPAEFVREGFACLDEVVGKSKSGQPITRLDAFLADSGGVPPTNDDIAEFLEHRARPKFEARSAWRERIGKSAPNPSQGLSANQGQPVTAAKPRTLTNGASATNASAPKPWSQADADAESIRIIEQLYASRTST